MNAVIDLGHKTGKKKACAAFGDQLDVLKWLITKFPKQAAEEVASLKK